MNYDAFNANSGVYDKPTQYEKHREDYLRRARERHRRRFPNPGYDEFSEIISLIESSEWFYDRLCNLSGNPCFHIMKELKGSKFGRTHKNLLAPFKIEKGTSRHKDIDFSLRKEISALCSEGILYGTKTNKGMVYFLSDGGKERAEILERAENLYASGPVSVPFC